MQVAVRYMAQLRSATGVAGESIELVGSATAFDLVQQLAARHGEGLRRLLLGGDGRPQPAVLVFVGDEQVLAADAVPLEGGRRGHAAVAGRGGILAMMPGPPLTEAERERFQWQLWVPGFGEEGQRRLKGASVLVSRVGGVGGSVAYQLAAAGVGRLVLAHAGNLRLNDLNRQLLMSTDGVGTPRAELAARRLRELNPTLDIEPVGENIHAANVERLVGGVDLVAVCARPSRSDC